jgi:Peptidase family M23
MIKKLIYLVPVILIAIALYFVVTFNSKTTTKTPDNKSGTNVIKLLGFDINDNNAYNSQFKYLNMSVDSIESSVKMQSLSQTAILNIDIYDIPRELIKSYPNQSQKKAIYIGDIEGKKAGRIDSNSGTATKTIVNMETEKKLDNGTYEYKDTFIMKSFIEGNDTQIRLTYNNHTNKAMGQDMIDREAKQIESVLLSLKKTKPYHSQNDLLFNLSSDNPMGSPLGGESKYTKLNASFHDPVYKEQFKIEHEAIDIVPSPVYVSDSKIYNETGLIPLYATCNGFVSNYVDETTKANVVKLECKSGVTVEYWHNSNNLWLGEEIKKGQIIALMGESGITENGIHLHYKILKNKIPVDPYETIFTNK